MLRFFFSIFFLFLITTSNLVFAQQEKVWQLGLNNQNGKAIINLPNNAGYLIASQNQLFNFNPATGSYHWGPKSLSSFNIEAMCKADSNHVFIAGTESGKATIKKLNYTNAIVISTHQDTATALNAVFESIYSLPNGNAIACGYLTNNQFLKDEAIIANVSSLGAFTTEVLPNFIGPNSQCTAVGANKTASKVYVAGRFGDGQSESIFIWEKNGNTHKVFPSKGQDPTVKFLTVAADNSIIMVYRYATDIINSIYVEEIVKLDANLNLLQSIPAFADINAAIATKDTSIVCTGQTGNQLFIAKLDNNLSSKWTKNLGFAPYNQGMAIDSIDNGFIVIGETGITYENPDILIARTSLKPKVINQIRGQVKGHKECGSPNAISLSGIPVEGKMTATGKTYFGLTDDKGYYTLTTDSIGKIEIRALEIINSAFKNCETVIDTVLANGVVKKAKTFYVIDTSTVPRLRVDLSTAVLVPNEVATYALYVKNTRSVEMSNVYVKLKFAPELVAVKPIVNDSIYIGKLKGDADTTIYIDRKLIVAIPVPINKTFCAEATVFPNETKWDGPRIKVDALCKSKDNTLEIKIKNNANLGLKAGLVNKNAIVIIDDIIMRIINIGNLGGGKDTTLKVTVPDNFNTFLVAVEQNLGNPYGNFAADRGENCNNIATFLPQTTYSDHDDDKTYSIECLKVSTLPLIGSFTTVFPLGGVQAIGKKDTLTQDNVSLEIHSVAVNTGNDTTKNMVLSYKCSENLKVEQVELGASSHRYTAQIDSNTLSIIVPKIELIPNSIDSKKSIAFFNFRLKIPPNDNFNKVFTTETCIRFGYFNNAAAIDTVKKLIKKLNISKNTFIKPVHENLPSVSIAPNPMQGSAQISVAEEWIGATFSIFDLQGRLVLQIPINQSKFQLYADDLQQQGMFLCKIELKGRVLANGKIVVQ